MTICEILPNIYYVGVNDRLTRFFEGIWFIPNGISYNAYLIIDEKVTLVEGGAKAGFERELYNNISMVTSPEKIDYIVVNHSEPDHSGTLPFLLRIASNAKIVSSTMAKNILMNLYNIPADRFVTVKDGDIIELGEHKLRFFNTPGVHWPDTIMTYEERNKILFSGDAFGSYGTLDGGLFDDEVDIKFYLEEAKRYYSNIVGAYAYAVLNALKKLSGLEIRIIAPSHGPIWRREPSKIVSLYEKLSKYEAEDKVLIIYGSMYGFTRELAEYIAKKLVKEGVRVELHNAVNEHPSYALSKAWDSKIIIFGVPTYENIAFPPIYYIAYLLTIKKLKNRYYAIFGSSGWAGGGYKQIQKMLDQLGWEMVEPVIEIRGAVKKRDLEKVNELVENIKRKLI